MLPALRTIGLFYLKLYVEHYKSATLNLRATSATTDPKKRACFNCSKPSYFADTCLNPCSTLRINKIRQEDTKTLSNNKATKEDNATDKSEN